MKKIVSVLLVSLIAAPAYGDQVYYLQDGESISDLLYNRLKLNPIYKNGLLQRVMKYNGLDERTAKKLHYNTAVKVPDDVFISPPPPPPAVIVKKKPVEKKLEEKKPVEKKAIIKKATSISLAKYFSLGFKPSIITGEGKKNDTSFSLLLLMPSIETGLILKADDHELDFDVNAEYAQFAKDKQREGNDSFLLGKTNLAYRYNWNAVSAGLHFTYGQRMLFTAKPEKKYELKTPWLYGAGPTIGWNNFTLNYLIYPEQTVNSDVKTDLNQSVVLTYEPRREHNGWRFQGAVHENSTEDIDSQQLEFGSSYVWYF